MKTLKENYNFDNIEITLEVNPGTVTEEKLLVYKKCGINRLSMGLQVTQNNLLKQLGRIHTYEEFRNTYSLARKVGFCNINVDLMIGIPNQTTENVKESIDEMILLNPEHISIYSLIVEEGTKLYQDILSKRLLIPSEAIEREMYWLVKNRLEENGYIHYEISNFSKDGYSSKYNLGCWEQREYFGFGTSSHSFIDNIRFSNTEDIEEYIENYKRNTQSNNFIFHERLDYMSEIKEYVMLGFRKIEGINKKSFEEKFKTDIYKIFKEELEKLKQQGLIQEDGTNVKLTDKGLDMANKVFGEFV